jgi:tetratricopeptide (TPR) repeat protein
LFRQLSLARLAGFCGLALAYCLWPGASSSRADEIGQLMVVVKQTSIRVGTEDLETLPRGFPFVASKVDGDWLAVANRKSGWVRRTDVLPLTEAISHFSKLLDREPKDETLHLIRGVLLQKSGDQDRAIADFSEVLKINPRNRMAYSNRAIAWKQKGQMELALGDYNEALRLDPQSAMTWHNRGAVWAAEGKYKKAVADFEEAIRLEPKLPDAYNALAWVQATCEDESMRDGKAALENAKRACELCDYGRWSCLGTLAAAHAELGNFAQAVEWKQKCLAIAPADRKGELQVRLINYQTALERNSSSKSPVASLARQ